MLIAAVWAATAAHAASAQPIYSNGASNPESAAGRNMAVFRIADDFELASGGELGSIRFWMVAEPGDFAGELTYAIYEDDGGALGGVVDTATVGGVTPALVNDLPGFIQAHYRVDFDLPGPLALGAGTYWLELHVGPTLTGSSPVEVGWAVAAGNPPGNAKQNPVPDLPASDVGYTLAFELLPEPGSTASAAAALAALGALRRRAS
jgi:hypothetical protein